MSRRGGSTYRLLGVLNEAGVEYEYRYRPVVAGFLRDGFLDDESRQEWLRKVIFAVKLRRVRNAGAYIKKLAENHIHSPLGERQMELYREAVEMGFGRNGQWGVDAEQRTGGRRG